MSAHVMVDNNSNMATTIPVGVRQALWVEIDHKPQLLQGVLVAEEGDETDMMFHGDDGEVYWRWFSTAEGLIRNKIEVLGAGVWTRTQEFQWDVEEFKSTLEFLMKEKETWEEILKKEMETKS